MMARMNTVHAAADPARAVLRLLEERGATLAVAESLTGGLVAALLVGVPGASTVFRGGAVVYATDAKAAVLGVDADLLDRRGAVDGDVAVEMARGARRLFEADVAVATTGVAGPEPQDGHDPGDVFVAVDAEPRVAGATATAVERLCLPGDRASVRAAAVEAALDLARRLLLGEPVGAGSAGVDGGPHGGDRPGNAAERGGT